MTIPPASSSARDVAPLDAAGPPAHPSSSLDSAWRTRDVVRATTIVCTVVVALILLWVSREIVLTTFLGVLFGLAVAAATDRLERLRVPRGVGAALIVFTFIGVMYGVGALIAPTLAEQGTLLRQRVPEAFDRIEGWVHARPGLASFLLGGRRDAAGNAIVNPVVVDSALGRDSNTSQRSPAASNAEVKAKASAEQSDTAKTGTVPTLRERVTQQLSGAARYLFPFLSSTVTVVAGLFLILVLAIYVGAAPRLYHEGLVALFPRESRPQIGQVLTRVATVLRRWLVTQLVAMLSIGLVTTVTLLILGVKSAFALGVIAGFLEFVPTVGPILSAVPAIAMGFLDSPEKALSVAIAYLIIQQIEGNVLIPMLMKEGMDLPPALTIVAQAVMALVFGFLGLLVAVPLLAAIVVPIKLLYVQSGVGETSGESFEHSLGAASTGTAADRRLAPP